MKRAHTRIVILNTSIKIKSTSRNPRAGRAPPARANDISLASARWTRGRPPRASRRVARRVDASATKTRVITYLFSSPRVAPPWIPSARERRRRARAHSSVSPTSRARPLPRRRPSSPASRSSATCSPIFRARVDVHARRPSRRPSRDARPTRAVPSRQSVRIELSSHPTGRFRREKLIRHELSIYGFTSVNHSLSGRMGRILSFQIVIVGGRPETRARPTGWTDRDV